MVQRAVLQKDPGEELLSKDPEEELLSKEGPLKEVL